MDAMAFIDAAVSEEAARAGTAEDPPPVRVAAGYHWAVRFRARGAVEDFKLPYPLYGWSALTAEERRTTAAFVGDTLRELHATPIVDGEYISFDEYVDLIQKRMTRCHRDHETWGSLPDRFLPQVRDYVWEARDLIDIGAYAAGSNPRIDAALAKREAIGQFLCQPADTRVRLADAIASLGALQR